MTANKILIVEDDLNIASLLKEQIDKYGFSVQISENFDQIDSEFLQYKPDLVLLDVNLPKFDGFYWCRKLRSLSTCPILFISARDGEMDQIMALEYGADDYITKPFHTEVIMAKIRSHLRRAYGSYAASAEQERVVKWEQVMLYPERLQLEYKGKSVQLSKKEADLMELLMKRDGKVASRESILEKLWDEQHFVDDNTLNVNVTRLRQRLQELGLTNALETVRGFGYRLFLMEEG
ncbi:response regulator transcription factor [Bacillus horti]|uniref:OmpR family two-component system response regulator YxdJ n=1 Tax=Caldalkalibacillus horti TaxID=77523 RepID=A0ABT9VT94_9BACI|nr:response regulator transcription factor [Bacillus horti]MDQ0164203.1 OmpR family two-component system response regulator YxdJ [Bacillus horti]